MDPILPGAAANLSSEATKGIFQEMKRHIRYVRIYEENVKKFREKHKMLKAKRTSVQQEVDAALRNGERIKADVEFWCQTVDKKMEEEEKKVKELEDKTKNKCFIGLCPNIKSRYQLSRKAEEDVTAFDELIRHCQFNGSVGYRDVAETIVGAHSKDFEAFESRQKVFNDVMDALKDDTISMIGIYGAGGVGKTTLVNEVANKVQLVKLFDRVVEVAVTQNPDIQKIQDEIAESLGLHLQEKSTRTRADRLRQRLMMLEKGKKILIVLDNIWKKLDLEDVGIPTEGVLNLSNKVKMQLNTVQNFPSNQTTAAGHNWCKILMTSRDKDVLSNEMAVKTTFAVGVLEENEAWDLFKKRAGDVVERSEVQSIAIKVAKRCAGLPLAIATVASALRNKPLFAWEDALEKLQTPSPTNFKGISAEVYSAIELSYNHLESDELKQTFLLCGLQNSVASFEYLLRYCMGLGLFHDVHTVEKTRNRLLTMVSKLKDSCLLNDSYSIERKALYLLNDSYTSERKALYLLNDSYTSELVNMHDLIRDVALAIASRDNHVIALGRDDVLEDWPDAETLKVCQKISLNWARIKRFPDGDELNCPQLNFFYMGGNESSVEIPTNFFQKMENLKVLDLTSLHFSSVPSINLLKKIRTLCLDHCLSLRDISIVGEMGSLEILSLVNSNIEMLPEKIGHLIKLKILDLSGCSKLKLIPPGVLSGLSRLVELYMGNSFVQWEAEGDADQCSNASLAEFKNLSCLTTLHAEIPSPKLVPSDLSFRNLQRYKICIGQEWDGFDKSEHSRALKLKLSASTDSLVDGVRILLKKAETLYLDDVKDFKFVLDTKLGDRGSFPLKVLDIQNGLESQYILDGNDAADKTEFLRLQSLTLANLPNLISFCPTRKRGPSTSVSQLEELPLFNEQIVFPCLEDLQLISINVARLWHDQIFCAKKLKGLIIKDCGNLKHLFSSSMARSLVYLENLEITGCKSLTEIISTEDIEEESYVGILFPQLCTLTLKDLQHLIRFCSESYRIEFPSLGSLQIKRCPKLKGLVDKSDTDQETQCFSTQALFNEKVACPSLRSLKLSSLNVQRIWHDQLPEMSSYAGNLSWLQVKGCHNFRCIFPSSIVQSLIRQLSLLSIHSCENLEEVLSTEEGSAVEDARKLIFHNLRYFRLKALPKLERFGHGNCFEFPLLNGVLIEDCPIFETFISDSTEAKETCIRQGNNSSEINFPPFFSEKVAFPQLTMLRIQNIGNRRRIWHDQFIVDSLNELEVNSCDKLPNIFPLNMRGRLQNLEILRIRFCDSLEYIFEPRVTASESTINFLFPQLTKLHLVGLRNLKSFYPGRHTAEFPLLKRMFVHRYNKEQIFAPETLNFGESSNIQPLFWVNEVTFPNLEKLKLSGNVIMNEIWPSSASFRNLTTLKVWECNEFVNLMACSTAKSLAQFSRISIISCRGIEEIIAGVGDEVECGIVFTHLKCLELSDLPRLASFCSGDYSFEFPSLEKVIVRGCPKMEIFSRGYLSTPMLRSVQFLDGEDEACWEDDLNTTIQRLFTKEVGYRGLKNLVLSEDSNKLTELWKRNPQAVVDFKDLRTLEVSNCSTLKYLFTISIALELAELWEIKVVNCIAMERIIADEETEEKFGDTIILPQLCYIKIENCENLTSFCQLNQVREFPSLKQIDVAACPRMLAFLEDKGIETIDDGDKGLTDVLSATFLGKVMCPTLQSLHLSSLNVQRIWPDDQLPQMCSYVQNLTNLSVVGCHSLKYLFSSSMMKHLLHLQKLIIEDCRNIEEVIFIEEGLADADNMSQTFPSLEYLQFADLPKLMRFCHGSYIEFPLLRELGLSYCPLFKTFISDSLVTDETRISEKAEGNNSDIDFPSIFDEKVAFPQLAQLVIVVMGNCGKIWKDQLVGDSFCKLNILCVAGCDRLLNIFPFTISERLQNLEELRIAGCASLEEIFEPPVLNANKLHAETASTESIVEETSVNFVFHKLTYLELIKLPRFKSFYSGTHTTEWPSLKKMLVSGCDRMKIFASESQSIRQSTKEQPLFRVNEVTFPNLEELKLKQNEIMGEIWHGQVRTEFFSKLKVLELICFPDKFAISPHCFIQSLPELQKLVVSEASFSQVFDPEGFDGKKNHALAITFLNELTLSELPELTHLWKEEYHSIPAFYELRTLELRDCGKLKTLVPSSVSFMNLTTLEVSRCHGLVNLIACSTAKSLVQLTRLRLTDCEMIEEIIACESDEVIGGMVFTQLKFLQLSYLPSLVSFCSGDRILEFPTLEKIVVRECPKIFCKGFLSTPQLQKVLVTEDGDEEEGRWEDDLKTMRLFEEMSVQHSEED